MFVTGVQTCALPIWHSNQSAPGVVGVIFVLDVHAQRIDHLIGTSWGVNSGGNH